MKMTAEMSDNFQERMEEDLQCAKEDTATATSPASPTPMIKTSDSHPINISLIVPISLLPAISQHVYQHLSPSWNLQGGCASVPYQSSASLTELVPRDLLAERLAYKLQHTDTYTLGQVRGEELTRLPKALSLHTMINECPSANEKTFSTDAKEGMIGNLLLSSCPGKKVRLDEPVQGRCGIRRDLKMDLERFKDMGVRAIVCCLDDKELRHLGSPMEEYKKEAQAQGFDLLWLPIAEGFAPVDVSKFDMFMSMLILNYTLRAKSLEF
ncbi:hypothetical protein MEQU1_001388 [Malassezia equina]|uniref:Uncharacterized protein n=1 Tax=Malassezia equina TaxID=1381935 RepID=A0AAF0EE02_9BASI|nr:hypothetical protein MEQU1_001388 [Malassezia equina]